MLQRVDGERREDPSQPPVWECRDSLCLGSKRHRDAVFPKCCKRPVEITDGGVGYRFSVRGRPRVYDDTHKRREKVLAGRFLGLTRSVVPTLTTCVVASSTRTWAWARKKRRTATRRNSSASGDACRSDPITVRTALNGDGVCAFESSPIRFPCTLDFSKPLIQSPPVTHNRGRAIQVVREGSGSPEQRHRTEIAVPSARVTRPRPLRSPRTARTGGRRTRPTAGRHAPCGGTPVPRQSGPRTRRPRPVRRTSCSRPG